MWLFPVSFSSASTPDIDYKTRYDDTGGGNLVAVEPTGVPGYAFLEDAQADMVGTSPVGVRGVAAELAPLPSVDIILATQAAMDPARQMTHVRPAKLAALGMIDAGDLVYGHDRPTLSQRVGVVP